LRLLLVEDSPALADALKASLTREGYSCDHAADGITAAAFLDDNDYDLVVLDWMLPRRDGIDVLRELRRKGGRARVLMLSARDQVGDRVAALDAGADDYIVKPFALNELLARLRALSRRPQDSGDAELRRGLLSIDLHARRARWDGHDLMLTPKEYGLLELLMRERGRVLSRVQIFERLYDSASESSDKVVEVIISTLRAKLAEQGQADLIETRRGFGYVLD
jgi:DNA-binding response OmpR family regulator